MQKQKQARFALMFLAAMVLGVGAFVSARDGAVSLIGQSAFAEDGEEDKQEDESKDEEKSSNESKDENKSESKSSEEAKKTQERQREEAKKKSEQTREIEKKKVEQEREMTKQKSESEIDDDADEAEDDLDDDAEEGDDFDNSVSEAQKKIAEAEREILKQQAEGKNVSVALASLQLAKDRLAQATGGTDQSQTEALARAAKKLADKAQGDDIEEENHSVESVSDAAEKVMKAEKKLAVLVAAGIDGSEFESQLADLKSQLNKARQLVLNGSSSEGFALAQIVEWQAKSLKKAIEIKLLASGYDDDVLDDHGSEVSEAVKKLIAAGDIQGGALGAKIREIAKNQEKHATEEDDLVEGVKSRGTVSTFFFGPDYGDLDSLKERVAENNASIMELTKSVGDITDQDVKKEVEDQINVLTQENTRLQGFVDSQESNRGIFGWVFRLFR